MERRQLGPWANVSGTDIDLLADNAPATFAHALAERTGWPAVVSPGPTPSPDQRRWPAGVQAPDGHIIDVTGAYTEADWLGAQGGDAPHPGRQVELLDPAAMGLDLDTLAGTPAVRLAAERVAAAVTSDPQFMATYWAAWGSQERQDTMAKVVDGLADRFPGDQGQVLRQVGLTAATDLLDGTDTLGTAGREYRAARDEAQVFTARLTGALMASAKPVEESAVEAGIDVAEAKRLLGDDVPTIYGKKNCPACALTERALRAYGVEPRKVDLGDLPPEKFAQITEGFLQAPIVHLPGVEPFSGFRPDTLKDWAQRQSPTQGGPEL